MKRAENLDNEALFSVDCLAEGNFIFEGFGGNLEVSCLCGTSSATLGALSWKTRL